jgi:hypothetical protein
MVVAWTIEVREAERDAIRLADERPWRAPQAAPRTVPVPALERAAFFAALRRKADARIAEAR